MPDTSVLIVGCGSIGRRHAANLRALGVSDLSVCDPDPQRRSHIVAHQQATDYADLDEALTTARPDAVMVCTPPHLHVPHALRALDAGAHVFIEKPLSHTMDGVDALVKAASDPRRVVQVGYNMRFHPGLRKVRELLQSGAIGNTLWARAEVAQYLPEWRPWQDYRESYTAKRSMGGGVLLDSSHEMDYLMWLLGDVAQAACFAGKLADLEMDAEDTASIILRFSSGALGEVHLDCVQRPRSRNLKLVGTGGTLLWDYVAGKIDLYDAGKEEWRTIEVRVDPNEMYVAEVRAFLESIRDSAPSPLPVSEARKVLALALSLRDAPSVPQSEKSVPARA